MFLEEWHHTSYSGLDPSYNRRSYIMLFCYVYFLTVLIRLILRRRRLFWRWRCLRYNSDIKNSRAYQQFGMEGATNVRYLVAHNEELRSIVMIMKTDKSTTSQWRCLSCLSSFSFTFHSSRTQRHQILLLLLPLKNVYHLHTPVYNSCLPQFDTYDSIESMRS